MFVNNQIKLRCARIIEIKAKLFESSNNLQECSSQEMQFTRGLTRLLKKVRDKIKRRIFHLKC